MFYVSREIHFSYGHRLLNYEGKCANLHGHNARVQIEVSSLKLNHQDMVVDFHEIQKSIGEWIDNHLDHKLILCEKDPVVSSLKEKGEVFLTIDTNPTAEVLAKLIFDEARKMRLAVSRVTLWETNDSFAVYHE